MRLPRARALRTGVHFRLLAFVLIACLAIPAAAAAHRFGGAATAAKNTLVFADAAEPPGLDPAVQTSSYSWNVILSLYDPLVAYQPGTSKLLPMLATSWAASKRNTVFTFKLRHGVKFLDGTPFNAQAVKTNIARYLAVNQGPAQYVAAVGSVRAIGAYTVQITLKKPNGFFVHDLTKIWIVSPAAIRKHARGDNATGWLATHADGTGPYVLAPYSPGSGTLTLNKNSRYWRGWHANSIDQVIVKPAAALSTRLLQIQSGDADIVNFIPPQNAQQLQGHAGVKVVPSKTLQVMYLPLNAKKGPLQNIWLRRAVIAAFDYKGMQAPYNGVADSATGITSTRLPFAAKSLKEFAQNVTEAKADLAKSATPNGGVTLKYCGLAGDPGETFAGTLLQQNLKQLGINVDVNLIPFAQMIALGSNLATSCDIGNLLAGPATADPTLFYATYFVPGGAYNWSFYTNPKIGGLLNEASAATTDKKQQFYLDQIQTTVQNDALGIPAVQLRRLDVMRSNISGYSFAGYFASGGFQFWYLSKK
jgi:peptide/nickel transport system substrate-binding protein